MHQYGEKVLFSLHLLGPPPRTREQKVCHVIVYETQLNANQMSLRVLQSVFLQQEISRHLRPNTLRALYGKDKVKNAVHCTDLPEDGVLEVGAVTDNTHTLPSACPSMWNTPTLFHLRSASDPQSLGPCINNLAFS